MRDLSWRDEPESLTWPEGVPTRSDARFPRDEALGEDPVGPALRSGLLITTLSLYTLFYGNSLTYPANFAKQTKQNIPRPLHLN